MEIRVWKSFACNNSSSFHLVARFADPKVVKDVEKELGSLFEEHAKQFDAKFEETDDYPSGPTDAATAFAKKHGFVWKKMMSWGDEMLSGDEPEMASEGNVLIIYHSYCGGGLPPEVNTYLLKRGGTIDKPKREEDELALSVVFKLPKDPKKAKALTRQLDKVFRTDEDDEEEFEGDDYEIEIPWGSNRGRSGRDRYGKAAYFSDGKTAGFYYELVPTDIAALKEWLPKQGATDVRLRLCESADHKKFRVIEKAKCTECDVKLEYVDRVEHDLESDQLACSKCGGMFGLDTFMGKKKKKPVPAKKMAVVPTTAKVPAKKKTAPAKKKAAAKKK